MRQRWLESKFEGGQNSKWFPPLFLFKQGAVSIQRCCFTSSFLPTKSHLVGVSNQQMQAKIHGDALVFMTFPRGHSNFHELSLEHRCFLTLEVSVADPKSMVGSFEAQKNRPYFPLNAGCLMTGSLIISWFMKCSPHNWVGCHPLLNPTNNQGPFFHCSNVHPCLKVQSWNHHPKGLEHIFSKVVDPISRYMVFFRYDWRDIFSFLTS